VESSCEFNAGKLSSVLTGGISSSAQLHRVILVS
jgi:hypothetical protein